ncbi:SDR family oxidoreductase [Marinobacterium sp. D7]|uniref:SDR family oxidoreductase n=1 Tax=Marinobacterium ramblicola TaxID=2849041 RepID=UPI001C2CF592|nr:SDR family oxidoreductase [Marinobacterium ramblicola]MBV1787769.1 SDR family oxidoreductase [Marinobacterium ramblicola]
MHTTRILIAGCGDVGTALGLRLGTEGAEVLGLRRTINQLPAPIQPIAADLARADGVPPLPACDYLVYCAAAKSRDPAIYRAVYVDGLRRVLAALPVPPRRLFLVSSTGVYNQDDHQWVDEFSPTEPDNETGRILLESERLALQADCPATVVRFSGIYGPGREHLLNQVRSGIVAPNTPIHYSNRIHRDDCAGILAHLTRLDRSGERVASLYLASDDAPTPISEVMAWLAQQTGSAIKEQQAVRRGGSKRCSNARLKASGYRFIHPDFRSGYATELNPS